MVERDVSLAELTGSHVHIAHMSARQSLRAVRSGKERDVRVTCEVTPHHFTLTDEALDGPVKYDTNLKMNPPLRERADRDAMLAGIVDGTIDVIASDHAPHHADEKMVEFDRAPFGIVGLETAVPLVFDRLVHAGKIPVRRADRALVHERRQGDGAAWRDAGGGCSRRHHDHRPRADGDHRQRRAEVAVEEHAVSWLDAPRRRHDDHRGRSDCLQGVRP